MRAVEKKRKPIMSARKWTVFIILIIVLIVLLINLFYQSIQADQWSGERYVKSSLREHLVHNTISYAHNYVWDDDYWIIKGRNEQDIERIVVWKDGIILESIAMSELLTEEQLTTKLKTDLSITKIDHVQPAFFRDELHYEVQTYNETGHKVFSFFTMKSGQLTEQFLLPK